MEKLMIKDLLQGKLVVIGFCERQCEDTFVKLQNLMIQYPEFNKFIQPLFTCDDPEFRGSGEIHFTGTKARIYSGETSDLMGECEITLDELRRFIKATEDFGVFINDDGNNALNI